MEVIRDNLTRNTVTCTTGGFQEAELQNQALAPVPFWLPLPAAHSAGMLWGCSLSRLTFPSAFEDPYSLALGRTESQSSREQETEKVHWNGDLLPSLSALGAGLLF